RPKTGGRAKGAKNRLSHAFLTALAEDFEQHGIEALKIARIERPVEYIKVVAGLMPKEFEIMDSRLTDLSDEELDAFIAKLRAQLRGAITQELGDGAEPTLNWDVNGRQAISARQIARPSRHDDDLGRCRALFRGGQSPHHRAISRARTGH